MHTAQLIAGGQHFERSMKHPGFYDRKGPFKLAEVVKAVDAKAGDGLDPDREVFDVKPLDLAAGDHLSFFDNPKYRSQFMKTRAGACLVAPKFVDHARDGTNLLVSSDPYRSFALALWKFYPEAGHSRTSLTNGEQINSGGVSKSAVLEDEVQVENGAVVGAEARIGRGTRISSGAVIGSRVYIGRDCFIGPNVTITNTLIGNRVLLQAGSTIGPDGFGYAMGPQGHLKVPQIGRVILQDDVEIGANTTIDRGALKDTIIGEGTKIDNLVQIGHNVTIGRHCVIVALTGISGSTRIGDFVVMGGQVGMVGHITIGDGARLAANTKVINDVPAGAKVAGIPAKPHIEWLREIALIKKLVQNR